MILNEDHIRKMREQVAFLKIKGVSKTVTYDPVEEYNRGWNDFADEVLSTIIPKVGE